MKSQDYWLKWLDRNAYFVPVLSFDFSKAFDTVPHYILSDKLNPSGPGAVRFCCAKNLSTVCTSRAGIRVPGGMGIRKGMEYAGSVFMSLKYWLIALGLKIELTFWLPPFLPVILCTIQFHIIFCSPGK